MINSSCIEVINHSPCIFRMGLLFWFLVLWFPYANASASASSSSAPRPKVVNVGAIFTLDSTIGRVANIAIREAVKDVNSNSNVLRGTKLNVNIRNSNCSGFLGLVEGNFFSLYKLFVMLDLSEQAI